MCVNQQLNANRQGESSSSVKKTEAIRVLMCSENVPPQVNGIARRVGHYADGLSHLGCHVDLLQPESGINKVVPHVNPWNFTARMMILLPHHLVHLVNQPYDVVHVVLPMNLSGMWLLAAFKVMRSIYWEDEDSKQPALVCSWHCNLSDYVDLHAPKIFRSSLRFIIFDVLCWILPRISDRILTPTKATDPTVISMWEGRSGVCYTGISKGAFSPTNKESALGRAWTERKRRYLSENKCNHLLICVGRLSPEKGVEELIKAMVYMPKCALWLVGDGPYRPELERLVQKFKLPVDFLGYQKDDALHSVYSVGDCFVCPSLTETFGQTVNEALASQVRVALPRVPVFSEAYSDYMPKDAFWEPMDRKSMARAILKQCERHANNDPEGMPDPDKLKSWDDASESLLEEYAIAVKDRQDFHPVTSIFLPCWYIVTFIAAIYLFIFSQIRTIFGGSVRVYFSTAKSKAEGKVKKKIQQVHNVKNKAKDKVQEKIQQVHDAKVRADQKLRDFSRNLERKLSKEE